MSKKEQAKSVQNPEQKWNIDLEWYKRNNRSLFTLSRHAFCSKCSQDLGDKELDPHKIISRMKDCCSQVPDFINERQPLLESAFHFFLNNGNEPVSIEDLADRLSEARHGDVRVSCALLSRLLESDRYYGFRKQSG